MRLFSASWCPSGITATSSSRSRGMAVRPAFGSKGMKPTSTLPELTQRVKELEDALRDKTELNAFLKEKNEELEKIIRNA